MGSLTHNELSDGSVTLSSEDVRDITRLLQLLQQRSCGQVVPSIDRVHARGSICPRAHLLARANAVVAERNRRVNFFSRAVFGEPAWDMLLSLYVTDPKPMRFRDLVEMAGAPATTAMRWLEYLERERFVQRRSDPHDRRAICIELLNEGRDTLDAYFSSFDDDFRLPR